MVVTEYNFKLAPYMTQQQVNIKKNMLFICKNEETDVDVATEDEKYDIPVVGPPSLLAYKPESKQPCVLFKKVKERLNCISLSL